MITLEKLLTELKAESLNEIVAGAKGGNGKHKGWGKGGGTSETTETMSTVSETATTATTMTTTA